MNKPKPKPIIGWQYIKELCAWYLDELDQNGTNNDLDFDRAITEVVLKAIYGPEVFEWMDEVTG